MANEPTTDDDRKTIDIDVQFDLADECGGPTPRHSEMVFRGEYNDRLVSMRFGSVEREDEPMHIYFQKAWTGVGLNDTGGMEIFPARLEDHHPGLYIAACVYMAEQYPDAAFQISVPVEEIASTPSVSLREYLEDGGVAALDAQGYTPVKQYPYAIPADVQPGDV